MGKGKGRLKERADADGRTDEDDGRSNRRRRRRSPIAPKRAKEGALRPTAGERRSYARRWNMKGVAKLELIIQPERRRARRPSHDIHDCQSECETIHPSIRVLISSLRAAPAPDTCIKSPSQSRAANCDGLKGGRTYGRTDGGAKCARGRGRGRRREEGSGRCSSSVLSPQSVDGGLTRRTSTSTATAAKSSFRPPLASRPSPTEDGSDDWTRCKRCTNAERRRRIPQWRRRRRRRTDSVIGTDIGR